MSLARKALSPARAVIAWGEAHRPLMRMLLGAFWTAAALFLIVIAVLVFEQQSAESKREVSERKTVRVACVRSKTFGPPFIDFLRETETRLGISPLDKQLEVEGKTISVLAFYKSTIPAHCPRQ